MNRRLAAAALFSSILTAGCGTLFPGTRQRVELITDPAGAVAVAEGQTILTPGVLKLSRESPAVHIRIEKDGFLPSTVTLTRQRSGLVWGRAFGMFAGYAAGIPVTAGEAVAFRLDRSRVVLRLTPAEPLSP